MDLFCCCSGNEREPTPGQKGPTTVTAPKAPRHSIASKRNSIASRRQSIASRRQSLASRRSSTKEDPIPQKLYVEDPAKMLSGTYLLVAGKEPNGMPLWKLTGQKRWVFSGPGGQWLIGDEEEQNADFQTNTGNAASEQAHGGRMPDEICEGGWLIFDEDKVDWKQTPEKHFNITSELYTKERQQAELVQKDEDPIPQKLYVDDPNKIVSGTYLLVPGRQINNMPLWKQNGQNRWVFCGAGLQWFIGDEEEERAGFQIDTGNVVSAQAHGDRMPDEICAGGWLYFNEITQEWKEEKSFNITSELFTKERQEAELGKIDEDQVPHELHVYDPNKILSGTYLLVAGRKPQDMPLWKLNGQKRWVFCGPGGQWFIGDEEEEKSGFKTDTGDAVSKQSHGGRMPDEICAGGWLIFNEKKQDWKEEKKFNITSELFTIQRQEAELVQSAEDPVPHKLFVEDPNKTLSGTYLKVDGRKPNGMPLWKQSGQNRWVFCGPGGQWFVGDEEEERAGFKVDTGDAVSCQAHGGRMPDEICAGGWLSFNQNTQDWKEEKKFNITSELYTKERQDVEFVQKEDDPTPKELYVDDPNKTLSGSYSLVAGSKPNDMPLWKHKGQKRWIFCGGSGQWFIGDEEEEKSGFQSDTGDAVSMQSHGGRMPDEICAGGWMYFNEKTQEWREEKKFNITSELFTKERQEAELQQSAEDPIPQKLFVEDPNRSLSGTYLLVDGKKPNGMPLWKHSGQKRWVFCGGGGQWFIGDEEEEKIGFKVDTGNAVSAQAHGGRMPDEICEGGWMYFDEKMQQWKAEKKFNITSELYTKERQEAELVQKDEDPIPQTLIVEDPNKILSGTYLLVEGREPNGMPLWKHKGQKRWVFCGGGGQWFIGDEEEEKSNFTVDTGNAVSAQAHGGRMPDEICAGGWLFFNEKMQEWQEDQRFNITSELYTKERQEAELRD